QATVDRCTLSLHAALPIFRNLEWSSSVRNGWRGFTTPAGAAKTSDFASVVQPRNLPPAFPTLQNLPFPSSLVRIPLARRHRARPNAADFVCARRLPDPTE